MKRVLLLPSILLLLLLTGCNNLPRYFDGSRVVAEVGHEKLYVRDVAGVVPDELTGADSAAVMERYVERWVSRQLKLRAAKQLFSDREEEAIDSLVEEYRQSLMVRRFDERVIATTDTVITNEQIDHHYRAHAADFKVKEAIVQGVIVRFDQSNRQKARLQSVMASGGVDLLRNIRELSEKNHFELIEFTDWVPYSEFLTTLPTYRNRNYDHLLTTGRVHEMYEGSSGYYFRITEIRRVGDAEPLSRIHPTLRRIIYNSRQQEAIRTRDREILNEALESGKAEIYR